MSESTPREMLTKLRQFDLEMVSSFNAHHCDAPAHLEDRVEFMSRRLLLLISAVTDILDKMIGEQAPEDAPTTTEQL